MIPLAQFVCYPLTTATIIVRHSLEQIFAPPVDGFRSPSGGIYLFSFGR
jgi:hypothetical protein